MCSASMENQQPLETSDNEACQHFSSLNSTFSPVDNDNNQLIIIIILTATVTVLIHFTPCAVHICCHGNRKLRLNKSEIKRELMERREWHKISLQNRFSISDEDNSTTRSA